MSDKKEYSEECKQIVADIMKNAGVHAADLLPPEKPDLVKKTEAEQLLKTDQNKQEIEDNFQKVENLLAEGAAELAAAEEDTPAEEDIPHPEAASSKPKKKRKKHRILRAFVAFICIISVLGVGSYFGLQYFFNQLNYVPIESPSHNATGKNTAGEKGDPALALTDEEYDSLKELLDQNAKDSEFVMADENIWNVLLIGSDTLIQEGVGRSDSMILITISKYTNSIVMTSLMRDMYLKIPEYGYDRINAALPWGGMSLLVDTIQSNFGIHVDNYAIVDFAIFQDIVNALGGLYLTPTAEEVKVLNEAMVNLNHPEYKIEYTNELTLLNGLQTLYYARLRNTENSDYDRTARQRKVLLAAKERVLSMDLTEILELITTYLPKITTDIDSNKCFSLLFSSYNILKNYEINQLRFPIDESAENATIDGMYVLMIDFEANVKAWQALVYGIEEETTEQATDENGMPVEATTTDTFPAMQEVVTDEDGNPVENPTTEEATTLQIGNYDDLYGYEYGYNDYDYGYDYGYGFNSPGFYY